MRSQPLLRPQPPPPQFHVLNVHTMSELKLTGNHLKGSRPVLSFDASFDEQPHTQLLKEMLTHVFGTPKRHHKSKPFFDHVLSFTLADDKIWFRNYQVGFLVASVVLFPTSSYQL